MKEKRPLFSKPAGCFVQLIAAAIILYGMSRLTEKPADIGGGIIGLLVGGVILLLGRKTR